MFCNVDFYFHGLINYKDFKGVERMFGPKIGLTDEVSGPFNEKLRGFCRSSSIVRIATSRML